jgi:hypothetical protein
VLDVIDFAEPLAGVVVCVADHVHDSCVFTFRVQAWKMDKDFLLR